MARLFDTGQYCQGRSSSAIKTCCYPGRLLTGDKVRVFLPRHSFTGMLPSVPLLHVSSAGNNGIEVTCLDHQVRRMHPIIAAYIADFPEQCLVAYCMENRCLKCIVGHDSCGDMVNLAMHDRDSALGNLHLHSHGEMSNEQFKGELGLRAIYSPFWATLPHNNIFLCITPDILHQLHKGVFKDHIISWCSDIIGKEELDAHFKAMASYSGL